MIDQFLSDIQIWYTDTPRHWSPGCEQYTGADSLITALRNGWAVCRLVFRQDVMHGGYRRTSVYFFELKHDTRVVTMPVISTPFIVRFIAAHHLRVIHAFDSEKAGIRVTAEEPVLRELALA
jgi:hypothetical protein